MSALGSITVVMMSLSIDANEQHVYIASYTNPLHICRFSATSGAITDAQVHNFLDGQSSNIIIHTLSNGSGYYVAGKDSTSCATICKYLFSSPTTSQCNKIVNISQFAYGQLMLSDNLLFMLGADPSPPYSLHLYCVDLSNISVAWANVLVCPSGVCTSGDSDSLLKSSFIYSFFIFGTPKHAYLTSFSKTTGAVTSSRYKSNVSCSLVLKIASQGDYIIAVILCSTYYLLV